MLSQTKEIHHWFQICCHDTEEVCPTWKAKKSHNTNGGNIMLHKKHKKDTFLWKWDTTSFLWFGLSWWWSMSQEPSFEHTATDLLRPVFAYCQLDVMPPWERNHEDIKVYIHGIHYQGEVFVGNWISKKNVVTQVTEQMKVDSPFSLTICVSLFSYKCDGFQLWLEENNNQITITVMTSLTITNEEMPDKRSCGSVHECCVNLIIWQAHFVFKCIWFSTDVNY